MAKKSKSIIVRHVHVSVRGIKRLSRKRIFVWFKKNLQGHPFILAFVLSLWLSELLGGSVFSSERSGGSILRLHTELFFIWLALVFLSNLLKEKKLPARWYFRKRFVFAMLALLPPLGFVLLWSGAKFKKPTKIAFSLIFGLGFLIYSLYTQQIFDKAREKTFFDKIVELVEQPKKNIYLKKAAPDVMKDFQFPAVQLKSKIKLTPSEISTRCAPAVVSIKTKKKSGEVLGIGSGFLVSSNGFIVTNMHVLESAYSAEIKIGDVIFKDTYFVNAIPEADIALVKVEAENLPFLPIGNSDTLVNGQPLVVLGNPWGLDKSVSDGLVSAVRTKGDITLIQMTAPVSPGSSGGPVINEQGEAVGITTIASFFITQNLNFAIPINYIQKLIKN